MAPALFVAPFALSATSAAFGRPLVCSSRRPHRLPSCPSRRILIRSDASDDSPDELLIRSAMLSDLLSIQSLLNSGASARHASSKNASLMTALMWASSEGHVEIAGALLDAGADANAANAQQLTAMLYAFEGLPSANPRPAPPPGFPGNPKRRAPPQIPITKRVTGHAAIIKMLLGAGADPRVRNSFGETCVHLAARKGQAGWVEIVIAAGVDVNSKSIGYEETAMHVAAKEGHSDVVRVLVENGGNTEARNRYGWTPLVWAAACGNVQTVETLLELGANPNVKTSRAERVNETTPLKEGRKSSKPQEVSKMLVRAGAIE